MKTKKIRRAAAGFCTAAMMVLNSVQSFAAAPLMLRAPEVSYNHRAEGGFTVSAQDKDLFTNLKNLVPGDVVENTVDITNNSSQSLTFYVKAYPDFTASGEGDRRDGGPLVTEEGKEFQSDLLDIMKMNITREDGTYLYGDENFSQPASGKETEFEESEYGIVIGSIPAHSSETLTVTVKLPGAEMNNDYADKFDAVDWVFYVEGTDGGGGGGNNGGGGGGGGSHGGGGGDPTGPGQITIQDDEVPLAPGLGDGDVNITIEDGAVPLGALPQTGDETPILPVIAVLGVSGMVLLYLGNSFRKKKERSAEK